MSRYDAWQRLLGEKAMSKIRTSKVLLVGAGGIGCELVKELVLAGFNEIHLVDLDTIDLSNLNRQFLFSRQHVKQPKATVAAEVASKFNPDVSIIPYVANIITDPQFTPKWFRSFDIAFNALDNAEARRHVNKLCVATDVPLIDCGSAGLAGQAQVILPHESECYDCRSHPKPKSFPVCTIRSTPSQPIHCVVWSKSFLFSLLFSAPEEAEAGSTGEGEDTEELEKLNAESNELSDLKQSLRDTDFMHKLVQKVYVADIERLLLASKLWKASGQKAPEPLKVDVEKIESVDPATLDEHRIWTLNEALGVLKWTTTALAARIDGGEPSIEFDKDDESALSFVAAATNLRSRIFGIPQKTKFEIKQMAGNIIPAVATTNAVVSGLGVVEALKIAGGLPLKPYLRGVNIFRDRSTALIGDRLQPPDPDCPVSSAARTIVHAKPETKLEQILEEILKAKLGYEEVSLVTDKLLYDPDFEDQISKSLGELNIVDNFITVIDEDDRRVNLEIYIDTDNDTKDLSVDDVQIPLKPEVKRPRDSDDEEDNGPAETSKRVATGIQASEPLPDMNGDSVIELLDDDGGEIVLD